MIFLPIMVVFFLGAIYGLLWAILIVMLKIKYDKY